MVKAVAAKAWNLPLISGRRYSEPQPETALGIAAAALGPGDYAQFTPGNAHGLDDIGGDYVQYRLDWHSRFFFDQAHGLIHLPGKSAQSQGGDIDWTHRVYSLMGNNWANHDASIRAINRTGHCYASFDMHYPTGDMYACPGAGGIDIWRWSYASQAWSQIVADYRAGAVNNPPSGMAVHPNLFGPGRMGTIISSASSGANYSLYYWNKETNTTSRTALGLSLTDGATPPASSHGAYFAHTDRVAIGRERHVLVAPNAVQDGTPTFTDIGNPPIRTMGTNAGNTHGVMMPHPGDPTRYLLLGKVSPWTYWDTQDLQTWTERGTHPFEVANGNPWVFCSLPAPFGCLWGIGEDSGLWRPPVPA